MALVTAPVNHPSFAISGADHLSSVGFRRWSPEHCTNIWELVAYLVVVLLLLLSELIRVCQGVAAEAVGLSLNQRRPVAPPGACNGLLSNLPHLQN